MLIIKAGFKILRIEKYPEAKAMAFGGVRTGKQKAKPDGIVIANTNNSGFKLSEVTKPFA